MMKGITNLYGGVDQWKAVASQFLKGSDRLAGFTSGIHTTDMETGQISSHDKGYYEALVSAVESGVEKKPLTPEMLKKWCDQIAKDEDDSISGKGPKIDYNNPEIHELVHTINGKISTIQNHSTDVQIVEILGDIISNCESPHTTFQLPRKVTHLIMSYTVSHFKMPLITFKPEEENEYRSAIQDILRLRILLSEKIRESVFFSGHLLTKVGDHGASEWYLAPGSTEKKDLIIEWHQLFAAVRKWKSELAKRDH